MMKYTFGVLVLMCALSLAGCVSERIEPAHSPRVTTAINSDGIVTLSFESRAGYDYRLFIMDSDTRQWSPVQGVGVIRGTGETITIQDRQNPRKPLPWYSVRSEKR